MAIDATLVLSGAVLTSYVGVTGLVHRMVLDRCLPQFLLEVNRYGMQYRIVVAFFVLCLSVLLVTSGKLAALAGVYTISFLSVMVLFGVGNLFYNSGSGGPCGNYANESGLCRSVFTVFFASDDYCGYYAKPYYSSKGMLIYYQVCKSKAYWGN